jgi:excisionase family DNA binding protein
VSSDVYLQLSLINASYKQTLVMNWTCLVSLHDLLRHGTENVFEGTSCEVEMLSAVKVHPRSSPPAFEPLLGLHEAASILGMHWKTLEGKARQKEVPAFKVGKRWRFRLSSLNSWLDTGLKSNTTDRADVTRQENHP